MRRPRAGELTATLTATEDGRSRPPADDGGRSAARGRKRGNNEGSVYQRADGRWVAVVSLGDGQRVARYAKTRAEAAARLAAALKTVQDGLPMPPERQTVGEFLTGWLETTAKRAVRPATFVSYRTLIGNHLVPELGKVPLSKLAPQHVEAMINRKLVAGFSPRRVDYMRGLLRHALNDALRWGLVGRNVAMLVRPPRIERQEIRPFTPDQARVFLASVQGDRLEALYSVALAVGLRQGEALGLCWDDVDLEGGRVHVRHALQRIDGRLQLVEPKTRRSRRTVVLPRSAIVALRGHSDRQLAEREAAANLWEEGGFVFTTPVGRPLDASSVTTRFQRQVARAGLPRQRFHDLRHACASLLLAQGVNPRVVMEILGHSQISLTLDTYSHVVPSLQVTAASLMDRLLVGDSLTDRPIA